ncbi:MAG: DUF2314 domain-containing protein [Pseudomonadota bacterium]
MSAGKILTQISFSMGLGLLGFVGVSALLQSGLLGPNKNVITVNTENELLQQAEEDALATLPRFLELAETDPSDWGPISLKIGMRGAEMLEFIWVENIERAGPGSFRGTLANDPVELTGLDLGSRVVFDQEQVSDWAVIIDGKGYGYYSVRAFRELVSEEEAAQLTAFLSTEPLPPNF